MTDEEKNKEKDFNALNQRLKKVEAWIAKKELQQISQPLDEASKRIINQN